MSLTGEKTMDNVNAHEGCAFLSGYAGSSHNHPIIYAGMSEPGKERLFVVSRHRFEIFEMHELQNALAAYCMALAENGYAPPAMRLVQIKE